MSNGATNFNVGDIVATIIMLGFTAVVIFFIVSIFKVYKKNLKRAEERLNVEKQQTFNLQKQVNELNDRVGKIEKLLKEVE